MLASIKKNNSLNKTKFCFSSFFQILIRNECHGSMEGLLTLTVQHELLFLPSLRQVAEPEHRNAGPRRLGCLYRLNFSTGTSIRRHNKYI